VSNNISGKYSLVSQDRSWSTSTAAVSRGIERNTIFGGLIHFDGFSKLFFSLFLFHSMLAYYTQRRESHAYPKKRRITWSLVCSLLQSNHQRRWCMSDKKATGGSRPLGCLVEGTMQFRFPPCSSEFFIVRHAIRETGNGGSTQSLTLILISEIQLSVFLLIYLLSLSLPTS
jgi:hypothetical protein